MSPLLGEPQQQRRLVLSRKPLHGSHTGTEHRPHRDRVRRPTSLADQTTKVHELRDRISEKEQEIADVRAEAATADASSETVESEAEEVADTPPAAPDGAAPDDTPAG